MRRMEVANLKLYDIDADRGAVMIRQGKGKKDRYIPISGRAVAWIHKYVCEARPELLGSVGDGTVFLTNLGEPFHRAHLTTLVRVYLAKSKIGKMGGCHLWRHTVATLMLENGADIRVIQELLGHAKISTTELYTRVSINLLKQVYLATHPGAQGKPASVPTQACNTEAEADLFATLAAEDDEEEKRYDRSGGDFPYYRSRTRPRYPRRAGQGPGGCRGNRRAGSSPGGCHQNAARSRPEDQRVHRTGKSTGREAWLRASARS
jgi:integrase/recombinase XerD